MNFYVEFFKPVGFWHPFYSMSYTVDYIDYELHSIRMHTLSSYILLRD